MNDGKPLINRVANSGLKVINLESYYPQHDMVDFDLKPFLFMELILKEKDFRGALKDHDWDQYKDKIVCVFVSVDAIIPVWAFMLVASYLEPVAHVVFTGRPSEYLTFHYEKVMESFDAAEYKDERVVIKGCSDKQVPASAYAALTTKLRPFAQSIMYGEPCSTVPIFKRPRKITPKA